LQYGHDVFQKILQLRNNSEVKICLKKTVLWKTSANENKYALVKKTGEKLRNKASRAEVIFTTKNKMIYNGVLYNRLA